MAQYKPNTEPNLYFVHKFSIKAFLTEEENKIDAEIKGNLDALNKASESEKAAIDILIKENRKAFKKAVEGFKERRELPKKRLDNNKYNIINVSPSALTRALKWQENTETPDTVRDDLIIINAKVVKTEKIISEIILKDLVVNGFILDGAEYIFFTSSAGQIRKQEMMFIKKSKYDEVYNTLTCGLTWDKINSTQDKKGNTGIIVNKYLAYLALCSSSSKRYKELSINKCIVVEDFESDVFATVDYISIEEKDGSVTLSDSIERKEMPVRIKHTDGCGMILPSKSTKAFTIRAPWIKGLLVPFDFVKFAKEADKRNPSVKHGIVEDIYGKKWDVLSGDIDVIFTRSQFKMAGYYNRWTEYQDSFKNYGCEFSKCKTQDTTVKKGKLSYQFLQTLTDFQDEKLKSLIDASNEQLAEICNNPVRAWFAHEPKGGQEQRPLRKDIFIDVI